MNLVKYQVFGVKGLKNTLNFTALCCKMVISVSCFLCYMFIQTRVHTEWQVRETGQQVLKGLVKAFRDFNRYL